MLTLKGHLTRDLVFVFVQNHINALADVFSNRNLGAFVEKLELIVLIFRDVYGGRDFFAVHCEIPFVSVLNAITSMFTAIYTHTHIVMSRIKIKQKNYNNFTTF